MTRSRAHLSLVLDEVLAEAQSASTRKHAEVVAIKTAAALSKNETVRALRQLASDLGNDIGNVTYDDLTGVL